MKSLSLQLSVKNLWLCISASLFCLLQIQMNLCQEFCANVIILTLMLCGYDWGCTGNCFFCCCWKKNKSWSLSIRVNDMNFCSIGTKYGAGIERGLCVCVRMCVSDHSIHDVVQHRAVQGVWGLGAMQTTHWASVGKNIMLCFCWPAWQEFSYLWKC